jgi:hypothetical protein
MPSEPSVSGRSRRLIPPTGIQAGRGEDPQLVPVDAHVGHGPLRRLARQGEALPGGVRRLLVRMCPPSRARRQSSSAAGDASCRGQLGAQIDRRFDEAAVGVALQCLVAEVLWICQTHSALGSEATPSRPAQCLPKPTAGSHRVATRRFSSAWVESTHLTMSERRQPSTSNCKR